MQYEPMFEGVVEGYLKKQIARNLWRFIGSYDFYDLHQEGYVTYLKCVKWYKEKCTIKRGPVFMKYFKVSLRNTLNDCSNDKQEYGSKYGDACSDNEPCIKDEFLVYYDIIESAPQEIGDILRIILNSPKEMFEALGLHIKYSRWSNSKFCKLLGISGRNNLRNKVEQYLIDNLVK